MNRFYTPAIRWMVFLSLLLAPIALNSQIECSPETPYHFVDLTGDADSTYISPLESRDGSCCGSEFPDVCIEFTVILDLAAQGLSFEIVQGAEPPGALFYQIDCGTPIPVGEEICLEGGTEYTLTFCKPGNNPNAYAIHSIPAIILPDTVITRVGCPVDLTIGGNVVDSTITWSDVTSGNDDYLPWLSCTEDCDTTTVTPQDGSPGILKFLICGDVVSTLCANTVITVCDTAIVQVVPGFEVFTDPDQVAVCADDTQPLTASLSVPEPGMLYYWYDSLSLIAGIPIDSGTVFTPDTTGVYSVIVVDTNYYGCQVDTAFSQVEFIPLPELIFQDSVLLCVGESTLVTLPPGNTYSWFPQSGVNPTPDPGVFTVSPGQTTTYSVTAVDLYGCENTGQFPVEVTFLPVAQAGGSMTLDCFSEQLNLDGSGSSSGPLVSYSWSGPPNGILNGSDTPDPLIALSGWYYLEVTNEYGGCSTMDSVFIEEDFVAPVAATPETAIIDCLAFATELSGSGSSSGPGIQYQWTTQDGTILYGSTALTVGINQAGTYFLTVTNSNNGCMATDSTEVAPPDLPEFTLSPQEIICTGSSITVDMEDEYTYFWSPSIGVTPGSDPSIFIVSPEVNTTYTVIAVDSIGCSSTEEIDVELIPLPLAEAGLPDTINCYENVVYLEAQNPGNQGLLYGWTGPAGGFVTGSNTLEPLVILPGWYYFNVLDMAAGCTAVDSVYVAENYDQPIAVTPDLVSINCMQFTASLPGTGSSSGPNISYSWTTPDGNIISGANSVNATADEPGTYYFSVFNNESGCEDIDTVQVSPPIPPVFNLPPEAFLCSGQTLEFQLPPQYEYNWSPSIGVMPGSQPGTYIVTPASSTNYTVVASDSLFCSTSQQTVVDLATTPLSAAGDPEVLNCLQSVVTLNGSAPAGPEFFYSWTGPSGGILSGSNTLQPEVVAPGWYFFAVIDLNTGCTGQDSVQVTSDLEFPEAVLPDDLILDCDQDFIAIDGTSSTNGLDIDYTWTTSDGNILAGQGSASITVDEGGTYYLLVADTGNGCQDTDTIEVTALPGVEGALLTAGGTCFELEDGVIIVEQVDGGTEPFVFALNDNPFTPVNNFTGLGAGTYDVTIMDANGCEWSGQAEVEEYDPIDFNLGADIDLILGETVQLNAYTSLPEFLIGSVQWSPAFGLSCTDCLNPVAGPIQNITYTVELTDIFGCRATDEISLRVTESDIIFVPNIFSPDGNGENEIFTVFGGPLVESVEILQIYDRWGNLVFENSNFPPSDPYYGWDGTFQDQLMNPAVFVYYTTVRLINGERYFAKGDVTLVR